MITSPPPPPTVHASIHRAPIIKALLITATATNNRLIRPDTMHNPYGEKLRAKSYKKFNRRKPTFANNGCRSHVTPQHSIEASPQPWSHYEFGPHYLTCSTSSCDASNCKNFSEHPVNDSHGSQGFVGAISTSTLHCNDPSLPQEPVSHIGPSSDKKSHQLCPSHIGLNALYCPPMNLKESSPPARSPSPHSPIGLDLVLHRLRRRDDHCSGGALLWTRSQGFSRSETAALSSICRSWRRRTAPPQQPSLLCYHPRSSPPSSICPISKMGLE